MKVTQKPVRRGAARGVLVAAVAVMTMAGSQALVAVPAGAQARPGALKELPALASEPAPPILPRIATGDFTNPPPHPSQREAAPAAPRPPSFDAARSVLDNAATTATERVWDNPDGTKTAEFSSEEKRFKGPSGQWRDIDLDLVAGPGGSLVAEASPVPARLGASADGDIATLETAAGPVVLRHPDGVAAKPTVRTDAARSQATYARALPGGRDVVMSLTRWGIKENVVLADAAASPSYIDELVLPPGVTARTAAAGIELLDAKGTVVATFAAGLAHDASFPAAGPAATTPVVLRLVPTSPAVGSATTTPSSSSSSSSSSSTSSSSTTLPSPPAAAPSTSNSVRIEVSIDAAWLAGPRAFPVTVDPSLLQAHSSAAESGKDTFVATAPYTTTNFYGWPSFYSGFDGTSLFRGMLSFDTSTLPTGDVLVSSANVNLYNASTTSCTQLATQIRGLDTALAADTVWNNKPAATGAVLSAPVFAHGATGCLGDFVLFDITALAQSWAYGAANNGVELRAASETNVANMRGFYSSESGVNGASPTLSITYNRRPTMATPSTVATASPPDGARIMTTTPTLAVNAATDPDGDTVWYYFRGTANADGVANGDAETGFRAIESGWQTATSYPVPAGFLVDGLAYSWHVYTWDHDTFLSHTIPDWEWGFTVDLHLGAETAAPYDAIGGAQVNLVSGNLVVGAASPAGLAYTYNSSTPLVTGRPPAATSTTSTTTTSSTTRWSWSAAIPTSASCGAPAAPAAGCGPTTSWCAGRRV